MKIQAKTIKVGHVQSVAVGELASIVRYRGRYDQAGPDEPDERLIDYFDVKVSPGNDDEERHRLQIPPELTDSHGDAFDLWGFIGEELSIMTERGDIDEEDSQPPVANYGHRHLGAAVRGSTDATDRKRCHGEGPRMSEAEKLLPCPFCGTSERDDDQERGLETWLQVNDNPGYFNVECFGCGVETRSEESEEAAISGWNRRLVDRVSPETDRHRAFVARAMDCLGHWAYSLMRDPSGAWQQRLSKYLQAYDFTADQLDIITAIAATLESEYCHDAADAVGTNVLDGQDS